MDRLVVEAVHLDLTRTHGGMPGLRDVDALDSALARPRQRHAYEPGSDLAALAAAYGYGLVTNHPFNDGNKRIAFVTMGVFVMLNGYQIDARETDVVALMLAVAAGELPEAGLAAWLRSHLKPAAG